MMNTDSSTRSLFAPEDVERWRNEHKRLSAQREVINRQLNALERMLSGASLYVDGQNDVDVPLFQAKVEGSEAIVEEAPPATMHDAIVRIVRQNPKGMQPKEIAAALKADPNISPKIKQSHPNYIYTALMRLVNRDEIYKNGSVYKPVQK
jgi:hypothetical protein